MSSHYMHPNNRTREPRFIGVSLPPDLIRKFDRERGMISRSRWFRHILEEHYRNSKSMTGEEKKERS